MSTLIYFTYFDLGPALLDKSRAKKKNSIVWQDVLYTHQMLSISGFATRKGDGFLFLDFRNYKLSPYGVSPRE